MYILDPTTDSLFMKIIDKINKWVDPAHVKMYSTKEFRAFLKNADLIYIASKVIRGEKVHIGEKRAL